MSAFPYRILFVRHGETAYNAENRLQDSSTSPSMRAGATRRAVFASPLTLAGETMDIVRDAMGLKPGRYKLDARLKELSFGAWEGMTWREVEARDPQGVRARNKDKWSFAPPGGESYAMLAERVRAWLDVLSGEAFVVAHGGSARALMMLVAGVPPARAAEAPILQGRVLVFENGDCRWMK